MRTSRPATVEATEVGLLRLAALGLAGPAEPTVAAAVRRLGAVQAQDLPGTMTSLALRCAARSRDAVATAFAGGEIVRSWPMRGTLHVVPAEDLGWMLPLTTPRPLAAAATRRAGLGLDDAALGRARELALGALEDEDTGLTRDELMGVWDRAGLAPAGGRGYHLLAHLAQRGELCFGPTAAGAGVAGEPLVVRVDRWIPRPRRLARDEALVELARRYFRGHGPATTADYARWTGLPAADVRAGIAGARAELTAVVVDGVEHLMDPATPDRLGAHREDARALRLLPGFDEFVLGYRDRSAVLAPVFADRIVPGGNGVFRATVVHEGRIVGTWKPTGRGATRTAAISAFTDLPLAVTEAVPSVFARLP